MEHPAWTLSGLCALGGIMGYARKGSLPSLIGGGSIAVLYGTAGYLLKENADYGLEVALGTSSVLLATGLGRAIPGRFKKPVPVVLAVLGALSTGYYGHKYRQLYL